MGRQAPQGDDQREAQDHGGLVPQGPGQGQQQPSGDGGYGIDVLQEDIRDPPGQHVPEGAAAYGGEEAQKHQQEDIVPVAASDAHHDPVYGKGRQAQGIEPEEHLVIEGGQHPGHMGVKKHQQEHNGGHHCGDDNIDGIPAHGRRDAAHYHIPEAAAAAGGGNGQDQGAEEIHFFTDADQCPGDGKGNGADEVEKNNQRFRHKLGPSFVSKYLGHYTHSQGPWQEAPGIFYSPDFIQSILFAQKSISTSGQGEFPLL